MSRNVAFKTMSKGADNIQNRKKADLGRSSDVSFRAKRVEGIENADEASRTKDSGLAAGRYMEERGKGLLVRCRQFERCYAWPRKECQGTRKMCSALSWSPRPCLHSR